MAAYPDNMPYTPTTGRIFTAPLDTTFPQSLAPLYALPEGCTFKQLTIDRLFVYYQRGKLSEFALPADARSFGKLVLAQDLGPLKANAGKDDPSVYYVGGIHFDPVAHDSAGLVYGLYLRLRYDPRTQELSGDVTPQLSPLSPPDTPSPVARVQIGLALRYNLPT